MRRRGATCMGLTAIAAYALLVLSQMAQTAPSEEEIATVQAAEETVKMSVAQIEVKPAEVSTRAATATQNAQITGKGLNEANIASLEATETATRASSEADATEVAFREGKQQTVSVAQAACRGSGGTLNSLTPHLDSDGLRTVGTKQASINSSSSSAEVRVQNVTALRQVAEVIRDTVNSTLVNQQAATDTTKTYTDATNEAVAVTQSEAAIVAIQRGAYAQELVTKQNTTVDLVNQHETALEAERQKAMRVAAEQTIAAADAQRRTDAAAATAAVAAATPFQASSSSDDGDDDDDYSYSAPSYSAPSYSYEEPLYSMPPCSGSGTDATTATAKSYLGVSYVRGGESYSSADCSDLAIFAWESAGVGLPHLSHIQYSYGTHVPIDSVEASDLIFWPSDGIWSDIYHIAIYLGGGQMIETPTFDVPVRIVGVYSRGSVMPYAVRL